MRISDWSSDVCSSDLEIAEPLRRDDVDIAIGEDEQERLSEADPDEGEEKGDEGDVTHRRRPVSLPRRRGVAARACAGSLHGRDRRGGAGATARWPSAHGSGRWRNCRTYVRQCRSEEHTSELQ